MSEAKEFKRELKELLIKYKATIDFECSPGSDLHGVYDEKIAVCFWGEHTFGTGIPLSQGYSVGAPDL